MSSETPERRRFDASPRTPLMSPRASVRAFHSDHDCLPRLTDSHARSGFERHDIHISRTRAPLSASLSKFYTTELTTSPCRTSIYANADIDITRAPLPLPPHSTTSELPPAASGSRRFKSPPRTPSVPTNNGRAIERAASMGLCRRWRYWRSTGECRRLPT